MYFQYKSQQTQWKKKIKLQPISKIQIWVEYHQAIKNHEIWEKPRNKYSNQLQLGFIAVKCLVHLPEQNTTWFLKTYHFLNAKLRTMLYILKFIQIT